MSMKYKDRSIEVSYLQIFLREYFGLTLKKVIPKKASEKPYWTISSNDPLQVTGYFDVNTYASLALYMAYNYPNESFPVKWVKREGTGPDQDAQWETDEIFEEFQGDSMVRLLKEDQETLDDLEDSGLSSEEKSRLAREATLIKAISSNIENLGITDERSIEVPDRIFSYIHDEVVTPSSSPEEILRIKKLISNNISSNGSFLEYTDKVFKYIVNVQKEFIKSHTIDNGTEHGILNLPEQFLGFKVTGYVDPWTEIILKGGKEDV